jgi:glutamine phosphoribosylpyrophosphate amidotransferase
MCWMNLQHGPDAVAEAMRAAREHERHSGGHAWGYAAWIDGELVVEKGTGNVPVRDWPDASLAIGHTRLATRGARNADNAHPFEIERDGQVIAALAHNGTWYGAPDHDWKSDTYLMAELLESKAQTMDLDDAVQAVADETGETFLVLTRWGTAYVHSGRFDISFEPHGPTIASSGYYEIPSGDILKIEAAEKKAGKQLVHAD